MKILLAIATVFALACGAAESENLPDSGDPNVPPGYVGVYRKAFGSGQPDELIGQVPIPPAGPAEEESEYGTAQQALIFIPELYGNMKQSEPDGPCTWPRPQNSPCIVPYDKIIRPTWCSGCPQTHSLFPGINFKTLLQEAVSEIQTYSGLNWTVTYGSSSSNEWMYLGTEYPGRLATTSIEYTPWGTIQSGGSWIAKTDNMCEFQLNPDEMHASYGSLSVANQKVRIKRLMKHEIGHCLGFSDFYPAQVWNYNTYLMNGFDSPAPTTFTTAERNVLNAFHF